MDEEVAREEEVMMMMSQVQRDVRQPSRHDAGILESVHIDTPH